MPQTWKLVLIGGEVTVLAAFTGLGLHLVMLIGFRNRASVLLNWSWNYLTYDRGARLIVAARRLDRGPRPGPG